MIYLPKKIKKSIVFFTVIFLIVFSSSRFFVQPAKAGAITNISYSQSGSVVGAYVQSSADLVTFTPATAISTGSVVTVTFPAGTTLYSVNLNKADFFIKQTAGGGCTTDGSDSQPTSISVNEGARTIAFTIANGSLSRSGPVCGEGPVTIKMRSTAGADEIQHPSSPTTTGVLQISTSVGGDSGSISNVTFVLSSATKLAFTTQPSSFATTNIAFATQPVVTIQDNANNTVGDSTPITITAVLATDTNTAGSGSVNATANPLAATAGVATFSGANYTSNEDIRLKATAPGLTPAFSDVILVSVPDSTPPVITSETPIGDSSSATITWNTNEDASSQVEYGLTDSYGNSTSELDTVPRVTSHAVSIPSLNPCTKYNYRAKSTDRANNNNNGNNKKLITAGCVGDATVVSDTDANVDPASGGTVSLLSAGKGVTLDAPVGYTSAATNMQIKQLDKTAVISALSNPAAHQAVGDYTYDMKALSGVASTITSFDQPIAVTIAYADSDLDGIDETSLKIFRNDGAGWSQLSNCSVDTAANQVSCTTPGFSIFGLFGSSTSTAASSTNTSGGNIAGSTDPSCTDTAPGSRAPWLYSATAKDSTSILLQFAPGDEPYDKFAIKYGTSPDTYSFAADKIGDKETKQYLVRSLSPGTRYYFRVRAGNGCAPGDWSNEIYATTPSPTTTLDAPHVLAVTSTRNALEKASDKYTLAIKIVDQDDRPLSGVKVNLSPNQNEQVSGQEGTVQYGQLGPGNYQLTVDYLGQQSQHTLNVSGDKSQIDITIKITTSTNQIPAVAYAIVPVAAIVAIVAVYLRRKLTRPHH